MAKELALPTGAISSDQRLTVFEDNFSPRPGTRDVYFERDQNEVKHLPSIISARWKPGTIFIELVILALGILIVGGSRLANRKWPQD